MTGWDSNFTVFRCSEITKVVGNNVILGLTDRFASQIGVLLPEISSKPVPVGSRLGLVGFTRSYNQRSGGPLDH